MDRLKAKYGETKEAAGFVYSAEADPSVIFKPKKDLNLFEESVGKNMGGYYESGRKT
jgi:hypothetical protein